EVEDVPAAVRELTGRGADVSLDCLGSRATATNSILSLRKRGRHVQVGLLAGDDANPAPPMGAVIAKELQIVGSHGLSAKAYPELLELVVTGRVPAERLVSRRLSLAEGADALAAMGEYRETGVAVIDRF